MNERMGPPESFFKRLLDWFSHFLQGSQTLPTDRPTDLPTLLLHVQQ